jgi:hypothetical protein
MAGERARAALEEAVRIVTADLYGTEQVDALAKIAAANDVDQDTFMRWTRIRNRDGSISVETVRNNLVIALFGRIRRDERVIVSGRVVRA